MNDPERLLDKSGGLAAALLRAGAEERPSSTSLRRALAMIGATATVASISAEAAGGGVGVIVSGAAGSAVTAVGAGSVSLALAAKWVAIGSLGGLMTVGAASTFTSQDASRPLETPPVATIQRSAPLPPARPAQHSIALDPIPPPAPAIAQAAPSTTEVAARPLAPPPRPDRAAIEPGRMKDETPLHAPESYDRAPSLVPPIGANAPPNVAESSLQLAKEVALVDAAWAAMKQQEYARALAELAVYEGAFPGLGLHPEVLFLRMEAEDRLGRAAIAKAHALRIVSIYPKSAQASRARALLDRP